MLVPALLPEALIPIANVIQIAQENSDLDHTERDGLNRIGKQYDAERLSEDAVSLCGACDQKRFDTRLRKQCDVTIGLSRDVEKVSPSPEGTRERILRTAIAEFSEKGYSGARVLTICRKSRANPRMIYHYFGGKDGLYVAVLEHVLGELRREELKLDIEHVAPIEGMLQLFDFTYEHFGKHPELIHILSGEICCVPAPETVVEDTGGSLPLIALISQLLTKGEQSKEFRRDIDPLQLYVSMVGFAYFHRSNAHTLSVIFKSDILKPAWQSEHRRYAREMMLRFLRPDPS